LDEYFKDIEKQKVYIPDSGDSKDKPKKFVFQIYPENIGYIDSLSYEEKHVLINQLISDYRENSLKKNFSHTKNKKYSKLIISTVVILLMIPVILLIINISLKLTNSNYRIYQGNFEKLFNNRY